MNEKKIRPEIPSAYWEIKQKQARISLVLFFLLFLFYLLTTGILTASIFIVLSFFFPAFNLLTTGVFLNFVTLTLVISSITTLINFFAGKKEGVKFILNNLRAYYPDQADRYHRTLLNILEEMKLSSGLPELKGYIIPSINLNSLSLLDVDGHPAVAVTEGLLAEASRDELEAVVAHETAHILNGDTFALTLICSLAAFYEKLYSASQTKEEDFRQDSLLQTKKQQTWSPFIYLGSLFSYFLISFLIIIISRNRELLADATAVELSRHPEALARIIYKAHLANSYLGEASLFTPLFLVPPDSREINDSLWDRLFNTHPPVLKRVQLLASMGHKTLKDIVEDIKQQESSRQQARREISSETELPEEKRTAIRQQKEIASAHLEKGKFWLVKTAENKWLGPFHLAEVVSLPYFTPAIRIKNLKDNVEAPAREFPQIRFALYRQIRNQPLDAGLTARCPLCQASLADSFYEGVKIKHCPVCRGKLVNMSDLEKIFARKEYKFSEKIKEQAHQWKQIIQEPGRRKKLLVSKRIALCPLCGLQMIIKPFNYHLIIPVYKCLKCQVIWFEADELEILQAIIESQWKSSDQERNL
ncbi:MAG: M48 family metalloprotease [Candidatus Aminicenantes bacterium]|nr:M48 family metalloprotease [Candidatus Aminicenantes bacterium]